MTMIIRQNYVEKERKQEEKGKRKMCGSENCQCLGVGRGLLVKEQGGR